MSGSLTLSTLSKGVQWKPAKAHSEPSICLSSKSGDFLFLDDSKSATVALQELKAVSKADPWVGADWPQKRLSDIDAKSVVCLGRVGAMEEN